MKEYLARDYRHMIEITKNYGFCQGEYSSSGSASFDDTAEIL